MMNPPVMLIITYVKCAMKKELEKADDTQTAVTGAKTKAAATAEAGKGAKKRKAASGKARQRSEKK